QVEMTVLVLVDVGVGFVDVGRQQRVGRLEEDLAVVCQLVGWDQGREQPSFTGQQRGADRRLLKRFSRGWGVALRFAGGTAQVVVFGVVEEDLEGGLPGGRDRVVVAGEAAAGVEREKAPVGRDPRGQAGA